MAAAILSAWYGYHEQTRECTDEIKAGYVRGDRKFTANNTYVGDPAPGKTKTLVIIWQDVASQGERSGFTIEGDSVPIIIE
ncbi:hypothetical protein [Burkholderia sp. LMG 32019]|uniref:hypothetical protein n=1 Tax=Burkholderia sp. LMG 32019 TaxID=3158173 RepID=UPI003C2AECE3